MKSSTRVIYLLCALWCGNISAACEPKSVSVGGIERTGIVCAPAVMTLPVATVLAFHGRGSNAREMAVGTQLHSAWPEALVVYLDGLTGNPGPNDPQGQKTGWQINPGEMNDRDVAFSDAVLESLAQHYNIDRRRVFAVGHSNGARMVGILWALRAQYFTALAFSAAQADTLIETAQPRSVFMGMGIHDAVVPFDWQYRSIQYAAARFGIELEEGKHAGVQRLRNHDGIELMSFIHSGGHIWPAEQTHMIVDFFKRQGQSSNLSAKRDVPHLAGVLP